MKDSGAAITASSASAIQEIPSGSRSNDAADRLAVQCVCGAKFRVKAELSGKRIKCPKCGQGLTVPADAEQPTSTTSGRIARPALPEPGNFARIAEELAALDPLVAEPLELKERLGKSKLKKLTDAIQKKNAEGKAEAEQRRQKILELGASADSRVVGLLEPLISDYWISVREGVAEALGELRDPTGVPTLVRLLADEVPEVRRHSIVALGKVGDARALIPLVDVALQDPMFRYTASESIVRIGKIAVPGLIELLQGDDPSRTLEAVIILGRIKDPSAAEAVAGLLAHRFAIVRGHAAETLGHLAEPKTAPALIRALGDADPVVRAQAAAALQKLGDKRAVKPLIKLLEDTDVDVCQRAATTLGELGDAEAAPAILPLLQRSEPEIRGAAVDALGKLGCEIAAEPLTRLFEDEDEGVRLKAVSAFRRFKSDAATTPLLGLLSDANVTIRQRAVDALGEIGNKVALDRLMSLLRSDGAIEVRMAAAKSLGLLRSPKALPALEEALDDDLTVRCRAISALGDIGDASSLPALLAMLRDPTPEVRYHASQSLAEIGHQNSRKPLEELLADDNAMVRRGAAKALIKLGDPRGEALLEEAAKEPRRKGPKFDFAAFTPDVLAAWLIPGNSNVPVIGAMVAAVVLLGAGVWFYGGALGGLFKGPAVIVARGNTASLDFTPDGNTLIVGRTRGKLELWNLQTGRKLLDLQVPEPVEFVKGVVTAPDGKSFLMMAGPRVFRVVDRQMTPTTAHPRPIDFVASIPGSAQAVTYSNDGTVYLWDVAAGTVKSSFNLPMTGVRSFASSPDGKRLAFGTSKGQLFLLDAETGAIHKELGFRNTEVLRLAFSSDGLYVVVMRKDSKLSTVEYASGRVVQELAVNANEGLFQHVWGHPTEASKAYAVRSGRIVELSLPDLKMIETSESYADDPPDVFALSADGKRCALGSVDESAITVVDLTGKSVLHVLDE